ncbi:NAC domain-containing protein 67-like [Triticum aestivum]|uniref:NAC domain-containing protein 67-like n=1 Tax=Triticum aestivum TaxID=4565 RepID=UPI001D01FFE6|nr:NAC domain-containing protein 67-like [Triticum aestivum]
MGKMPKAAAVGDDWLNRHGFPQGYHFVPEDHELLRLLDDMIAGRALPYPLPSIFHGVRIRNYHPAELHELYKAHKEAGSIYFYNQREFSGSARVRPGRTAKDGWWKASGGGLPLMRRGLVVGYKLTLVFYEKKPGDKPDDKTDWIIKEYTIVGPNMKVI